MLKVILFRNRVQVCRIGLRHGGQCSETGGDAESFPASRLALGESRLMEQEKFTSVFCARPQNFAWFLGAGTSRAAGLPTATDIIWDLKRQYYCREENQEITRQDVQNPGVRDRIQSFMEARDFPAQWADDEYAIYFEKMFGEDKERQRRYLRAILSEDRVTLSVGNRVLAALMISGLCRVVFTTNFDSVVEKAVAEVGERSLSAYHLEGSNSAVEALNNEEYPLYCKLHGDFRYDSLKNLSADLERQNNALSRCLVDAGNRFGLIVAGYSGRDASIMSLFRTVLDSHNPFPNGLYWTGIKGFATPPSVDDLLKRAREKGVDAHYVPIETFDALLLRLWRNIDKKSPELDARVRKARIASVRIALPQPGRGRPLLRLNALPIISMPRSCVALTFRSAKDWEDLRLARNRSKGNLILTKSDRIWCWGVGNQLVAAFGDDLLSADTCDLPTDLTSSENLHFKRFVEEALCAALAKGKPLLSRTTRDSAFLIADRHAKTKSGLEALSHVVGGISGTIPGILAPVTEQHPEPVKVDWAEAVQVSIDFKNGRPWLLLDPDIWIWPARARHAAVAFLDERRSDRFNQKYNTILDAWIRIVLGTDERKVEVSLRPFDGGSDAENPSFSIGSRTAFARRLVS